MAIPKDGLEPKRSTQRRLAIPVQKILGGTHGIPGFREVQGLGEIEASEAEAPETPNSDVGCMPLIPKARAWPGHSKRSFGPLSL